MTSLNLIFIKIEKFKKDIYNISWDIIGNLFGLIINFVISILVARYLGPESYGVLMYSLALLILFQTFGHLGLSGLVVREIINSSKSVHEILGTTFWLKFFGYSLSFVSLFLFVIYKEGLHTEKFLITFIISFSFFLKPFNVIEFWFKSQLQNKFNSIAKTGSIFFSSIIRLFLIISSAGLISFAVTYFIEALIFTLFLVFFYYSKSGSELLKWRFSYSRSINLMSNGWKIFFGALFATVYLKIDQVMLNWYSGSEEVGIYALASKFSEVWYFVPNVIVMNFFPRLIQLKSFNKKFLNIKLQKIIDLLFLIALIVAIFISFNSSWIVSFFLGENYSRSAPILSIHIWAGVFIFMRSVFSKWILMENDRLIFSIITQGVGALANIILNYWLIPLYGGIGAAFATLISYSLASYFVLLIFPKTRPIFWMMTKSFFFILRFKQIKDILK